MAAPRYLKSISTKKCGLTDSVVRPIVKENDTKAVAILRVAGFVNSRKKIGSQFGESTEFGGEIAAINLITGEEFQAPKCFLPVQATMQINSMLDDSAEDGGSGNAQFALEITVEHNVSTAALLAEQKGAPIQYEWGMKPLIEFKGESALMKFMKSLPAPKILSLPAPAASEKKSSKK